MSKAWHRLAPPSRRTTPGRVRARSAPPAHRALGASARYVRVSGHMEMTRANSRPIATNRGSPTGGPARLERKAARPRAVDAGRDGDAARDRPRSCSQRRHGDGKQQDRPGRRHHQACSATPSPRSLLKLGATVRALIRAGGCRARGAACWKSSTNLVEAADRAGMPHVIPSDVSVDLHKLDCGDLHVAATDN